MRPDPEARTAEPEAKNAALREQVELLAARVEELPAARVEELPARLATASHHSGKPPSSDGLKRQTKSLRKRSGRRPGGQLGHRGVTLRLVATPDDVVEHRPPVCTRCQTALDGASVARGERRQVWDLPPLRLVVREHQALHLRCPTCQAITAGVFPPEAPSQAQYGPRLQALALAVFLVEAQFVPCGRAQHRLADLFGVRLARGSVVGWVQQVAGSGYARAGGDGDQGRAAAGASAALRRDRRPPRRAAGLGACGEWWPAPADSPMTPSTPSAGQRRRTPSAFCPASPASACMTAGLATMPTPPVTTCCHALCTVHHLRELTCFEEEDPQAWAKELKDLLQEMRTAHSGRPSACPGSAPTPCRASRHPAHPLPRPAGRWAGRQSVPCIAPSSRSTGTSGTVARPQRNLLERRRYGRTRCSPSQGDLTIPCDNNQAERDLRGLKVHLKVSGCFRSDAGADAFACLGGYLATMRKHGQSLLATRETVFTGQPLYPDVLPFGTGEDR